MSLGTHAPNGVCDPKERAAAFLAKVGSRVGQRGWAGKDPGHGFTSVFLGWPLSLSESGQGRGELGGDTPSVSR